MEIFEQAAKFWQTNQPAELSPLAVKHLEETLEYAGKHPEAVIERAGQLDAAITRFNQQRIAGVFDPDAVNSKKLAEEILEVNETLPLLAEMPADEASRSSFFSGFLRLVHHHYYTSLDKPKLEDSNLLITGLLVDGYSFALRAKRAIEHKHTSGKDDLIICNSICEMVEPGILQTEMYLANWYKPDYGLSPDFCDRINNQFVNLKQ